MIQRKQTIQRRAFNRTFRTIEEDEKRREWHEAKAHVASATAIAIAPALAAQTDRTVQLVEQAAATNPRYLFAVEPPVSRRRRNKSKYASRERQFDYMGWVKAQPCLLCLHSKCYGVVEADHAGDRGLGQKSSDWECIPLCTGHHRDRTDMAGPFKGMSGEQMRDWRRCAVLVTQEQARCAGWTDIPQPSFVSNALSDLEKQRNVEAAKRTITNFGEAMRGQAVTLKTDEPLATGTLVSIDRAGWAVKLRPGETPVGTVSACYRKSWMGESLLEVLVELR